MTRPTIVPYAGKSPRIHETAFIAPGACLIGEDALVGHMAILHACTVEEHAFVGMGSIALDGARIGAGAMLAAGALLGPGKAVPARELWAGRPARFMRAIGDEEFQRMGRQTALYCEVARGHAAIVG